jgi:hypothetical protein
MAAFDDDLRHHPMHCTTWIDQYDAHGTTRRIEGIDSRKARPINRASIDLKTGFNSVSRRLVTAITQPQSNRIVAAWPGQHVFLLTPIDAHGSDSSRVSIT